MVRAALPLVLVAALVEAAQAQDRTDNEALMLRLIFQGCLGYVRDGTAPFAGLPPAPLRPKGIQIDMGIIIVAVGGSPRQD